MSNFESAIIAIEAELAHARQGLAHYQSRIDALDQVLTQLADVDEGVAAAPESVALAIKRRKAAQAKTETPMNKQAYARASKDSDRLPYTGGDYWSNLITAQPQSGADILHAAIAKLGFTPTRQQVQKLTNRVTFALRGLVQAGKIKDSGSGRARRYFKK